MNNQEKQTYVKEAITKTLINLMKSDSFQQISISQITQEAQVSRNSFYRNFSDKEDIIRQEIHRLLVIWMQANLDNGDELSQVFTSFFDHLYENQAFYLLIRDHQLFHLFLEQYLTYFGPKPEYDNMGAYASAFASYGTYGWIEEWIKRGMTETADTMKALLKASGMT